MSKPVFSDLFSFRTARRNRKSFLMILLACVGVEILVAAWIFIPAYSAQREYMAMAAAGQGLPSQPQSSALSLVLGMTIGVLRLALLGGVVVVVWAATAQRFHDLGLSGWSTLWMFVPIVQFYFLYLLLARPGQGGENRFGPDPLARR